MTASRAHANPGTGSAGAATGRVDTDAFRRSLSSAMRTPARTLGALARTTAFFLKVLPMLPSRPVDWLTRLPVVEQVTYPTAHGTAQGELYRPATGGPHAAVVVCLGVVPFGVDHPQVPRLGHALARAGFAALLYWSPSMRDRLLDPADAGDIALAYDWLVERSDIDATRSGLLGTCVGGAFALLAAAQPQIRDRVAFVAAFAPYSSMWTLARDIASATRSCDDRREPWSVDPLTRDVFARSLTAALESGGPHQLADDERAVQALLTGLGCEEVELVLRDLSPRLRERFDALSPLAQTCDLRAPLIVLGHDRDDAVVPVGESRHLREALAGRTGVHYTEFGLFQHADPTKRRLPPHRLVYELGKFFGYAYPLFRLAAAA